jgi:chemotaxis signal transduction protein
VSSAPRPAAADAQRLALFEVAGVAYALPIADVLEVIESGPMAGIPCLPRGLAGVMNHHGDALPVVSRQALFEVSGEDLSSPQHVLVLSERGAEAGRLGIPVDRVVGLADAVIGAAQNPGLVVERLSLRGRLTSVLDARRLLQRAAALIEVSMVPTAAR